MLKIMNTYISTLFLFCHNEVPTLDAVILLTSWTMTREGGLGLCLDDGGRQERSKASGNQDMEWNVIARSYCMIFRRDAKFIKST